MWQREPGTDSLESLRQRTQRRLVGAIEQALRGVELGEPMWCMALQYEPARPLPPVLLLGSQRERVEWGTSVDLLNPAEWDATAPPRMLTLDDEELVADCLALAGRLAEASEEGAAAGSFLDSVAKKLNTIDWGESLDITDDFFVYATDTENVEPERHVHAAVPPERIKLLAGQGLIPRG